MHPYSYQHLRGWVIQAHKQVIQDIRSADHAKRKQLQPKRKNLDRLLTLIKRADVDIDLQTEVYGTLIDRYQNLTVPPQATQTVDFYKVN